MPTQSNAEIVTRAMRAQNRGDDEAFLSALADDIEWAVADNPFETAASIRGRAAVAAELERARGKHGRIEATLHEVRESEGRVLVLGTVATTDGTRFPRAWIWQVAGGKVVHVRSFTSEVEALEAFGGEG